MILSTKYVEWENKVCEAIQPWIVYVDNDDSEYSLLKAANPKKKWDDIVIAQVYGCGYNHIKKANANLIAAAPDMYEAIRAYLSAIEYNRRHFNNVTLLEHEYEEIFKAALNKANPIT